MELYTWKQESTEKLVGKRPMHDASGNVVLLPSGKPKMERETVSVSYDAPYINPLEVKSPEDLAIAVQGILTDQRKGFESLRAVVEHMNFGFVNSLRRVFNSGNDIKYSASQLEAIKLYRNIVRKGHMPLDVAVGLLTQQGIDDAAGAIALEEETADASSNGTHA
jgi:hypothetical protein